MRHDYENPPKTDKAGFMNMLKMVANALEDGNPQEAGYLISDAIDTFSADRVQFDYDAGLLPSRQQLLATLSNIYSNAAESPEWIRERINALY
jgi:hypothetical protein